MIRNCVEYSTTYISGPATEPVTIEEIRGALRMELEAPTEPAELARWNAENAGLLRKAAAARREAESVLGKRIGAQVWDLTLDWWPNWNWRIPLEPVNSIEGIYYVDSAGDETTYPAANYLFSAVSNRFWLKPGYGWPEGVYLSDFAAVRFRLNVGILPPPIADPPIVSGIWEAIREAILFRVGTFDSIREDMTLGTTLQASKVGTFESLLNAADRTIGV